MDPFNIQEINKLLASSTEVSRDTSNQEKRTFEEGKRQLLAQFDNHPVTQEIAAGADSENISGTLNGRGNLFSFIGFPLGSAPIVELRDILVTRLTLGNPVVSQSNEGISYRFPVNVPLDEIYESTPLPFEVGNSWVAGIEQGISGFSNFLYVAAKASRSGKGIETKNIISGQDFKPTPYLLAMLKTFIDNLGGHASNFDF